MQKTVEQVERKFLASRIILDLVPMVGTGKSIEQGYVVSKEDVELRIRRSDDDCFIAAKGEGTLSRDGWEKEIPRKLFDALAKEVKGHMLKKMRRTIFPNGSAIIHIDIFLGPLLGLVIIECKFVNEAYAEAFVLPKWAQDAPEVTNDKRFQNKNLKDLGSPPEFTPV